VSRRFCLWLTCFAVAAACLSASAQVPEKKPQKYAVLIGVGKYAGGLGELPCCQNDLNALKNCLLASGFAGEHIVHLHDNADDNLRPTKANIETQLALRMKLPTPGDQVVVAFSGHGMQIDGVSYLCPLDARVEEAAATMIALDDFEREIGQSPAKHKLLILDAWRRDPLRGAKAARGELPMVPRRPRGLRVLTSCEIGQISVDDPKLKRGVFMHYLTEGWQGAADSEAEGNRNGKVSLEELYYFVHEKTKIHVANAYASLQLPSLRGDTAGGWDLAVLASKPDVKLPPASPAGVSEKPLTSVAPKPSPPMKAAEVPPPDSQAKSPAAPTTHPLLTQANALFNRAEYDQAIAAYTSIIMNPDLSAAIRRSARLGRGSSYLAKGGKDNIQRALTDHKAAGHDVVSLPVRKEAHLMVSANAVGAVKVKEVVQISMINGDWVWVASVNGNTSKRGYVKWEAILPPPPPPPPAPAPQPVQNFQNFNSDFEFFE
jgi:hypothetical protein